MAEQSIRSTFASVGQNTVRTAQTVAKAVPPINYTRYSSDLIGNKANNESSNLRTTFGNEGNFYLDGGARDPKNFCEFSYPGFEQANQSSWISARFGKIPATIRLPLSPVGVSWNYQMRYRAFDTLGGQVIQILGVDITDLTIQGYFGFEGHWGKKVTKGGTLQSGYPGNDIEWPKWDKDPSFKNGLIQLAHWFREYFDMSTQRGNWDTDAMIFRYPQRGWTWIIRPRDFPRIRFANDEITPQWVVTADFVEDLQGHFTQDVKGQAKADLGDLKNGVGFVEFTKWSGPETNDPEQIRSQAAYLGTRYADYLNMFTEGEVQRLLENRMTFMVNPNSEFTIDQTIAARQNQQEQDDT